MRIPRRLLLGPQTAFHMMWRTHNREFLLAEKREKHAYLAAVRDDYLERCSRDDFRMYSFCCDFSRA